MLLAGERASRLLIPSVEQDPPLDEAFARETGAALAHAVGRALSGLLPWPARCEARAHVLHEVEPPAQSAQVWVLEWGAPGPTWQLSLPALAAEGLLAGLLGYADLRPGHPPTSTDLALLELALTEVARETSRELHLPAAVACQATVPGGQCRPLAAPVMQYALALEIAGRCHDLWVCADWEKLLSHLRPVETAGLKPSALAQASITVEARLPGPELTAQELLELQTGDVIRLGLAEQETVLVAGGVPVGRGRGGARQGRLAVSIGEMSSMGGLHGHGS